MMNCWEFKKCGKEPNGIRASKLGVCHVATCKKSDGFLGGKNAGKACAYYCKVFAINGTETQGLSLHKELFNKKNCSCENCDFHKILKDKHGEKFSELEFRMHIANNME